MRAMTLRVRTLALGAAVMIGTAACASAGAAPPSAAPAPTRKPAAVQQTASSRIAAELEPSAAARRVAEHAKVTGTELGTMWTFENPPLQYWKKRYDFTATPQWLTHLRLAALRYGQICSASFVSSHGLVMTNHHCARECIDALSTQQHDYGKDGFYAPAYADEKTCPGLYVDQLVNITDVTAQVQGVVKPGMTDEQITAAQDSIRKVLETQCEAGKKDTHCQVVVLFRGGQDQLYTYHRYSHMKLVFAPEMQAAFFGGNPDNFTYPRYDLDISFVRAYNDDGKTPAVTPEYMHFDTAGPAEGDLVFTIGNPGSTSRMSTVAELLYERRYRHPLYIWIWQKQLDFYNQVMKQRPETVIQLRNRVFDIENSLKDFRGELKGLRDSLLVGQKIAWQHQFESRIDANPQLKAEYGDVWQQIKQLQVQKLEVSPALNATDFRFFGMGSIDVQLAGELVQYLTEKAKPDSTRSKELTPELEKHIEQQLTSDIPMDKARDIQFLTNRLQFAKQYVDPSDPFMKAAFQGDETPAQAAARLVNSSQIGDTGFRTTLVNGGLQALESSTDPLIRLALAMNKEHEELQPRWQQIQARQSVQEERLGKALFAAYGKNLPPEASFTLRISGGVMKGYPYNGTLAPAKTSFYGLYGRAADFDNKPPFNLSEKEAARRGAVDLATPLDFVTTDDIIGGNSGSAMVNREGRLVGIAFDSNIEGLPNNFLFTDAVARSVGVDVRGILEGLRSIYQANALVNELMTGARR